MAKRKNVNENAENEFQIDFENALKEAEVKYNIRFPTLRRMIKAKGYLPVAKQLLGSTEPSRGYIKLLQAGRPDLSLEYIALHPKFIKLFSNAEVAIAREKLLTEWDI